MVVLSEAGLEASGLKEVLCCRTGRQRWTSDPVILHDEHSIQSCHSGIRQERPFTTFNVNLDEVSVQERREDVDDGHRHPLVVAVGLERSTAQVHEVG